MAELAIEGEPVNQACLTLGVSRSGFYDARSRPPSARSIRQAWLTDQITAVHQASRQTYGAPRVRAELVHGRGVTVSRKTVALPMRRAGLTGLSLRRKVKRVPAAVTVTDLVKRDVRRDGPNQLWVTDITEHPTREGKVYCCVVLDAYSRRVVGWAIDSRQRADLATAALGMAIDSRGTAGQVPDGIIHADHGTQFTSWTFTESARKAGLLPSLGTVGDPYDNAIAEAFWARLHTELLDRQRWRTRVELASAIFEYIEGFDNRRRRHSALDWMSPIEFETTTHMSSLISSPPSPRNRGNITLSAKTGQAHIPAKQAPDPDPEPAATRGPRLPLPGPTTNETPSSPTRNNPVPNPIRHTAPVPISYQRHPRNTLIPATQAPLPTHIQSPPPRAAHAFPLPGPTTNETPSSLAFNKAPQPSQLSRT